MTLLKSCAIPPASLPTASIFCVWRSSSSSSFRAVMSSMSEMPKLPSRARVSVTEAQKLEPSLRSSRFSNVCDGSFPDMTSSEATLASVRSSGWVVSVKCFCASSASV